jgi:tungstate transport system ATP-binding protein
MMTSILELRGVSHRYNGRPVLQIPALQVQAGTIVGLVGPNGSGKSTLLKILGFVEKCTAGQVLFQGEPAEPFNRRVRSRVSLLTQEPYLLKRSVFDNVAYGLQIRRKKTDLRSSVFDALELVGLHESFARRQWYELSGGEAQRVALAARLALKPRCLLLDEPTANVDIQSAERIRQAVLMARREWKTTLIVASHHRPWLNDICDHLVFLYNGRIFRSGMENVLFGPWHRMDNGRFGKKLAGGQVLVVTKPKNQENSCVIKPEVIILSERDAETGADNALEGKIVSVFKENHSDTIRAHVTCDGSCFTVDLSKARLPREKWFPGQRVLMEFYSGDIIWLNS